MYDATHVFTGVATHVSWRKIHGKGWRQISIEKKLTVSTFERSIIGSVKNTTDLDPPRLSASNPICFFPKELTHKMFCFVPTSSLVPTTYLFRSSHTVSHAWDVRSMCLV
jgi:hypothetical protein